MLMTMVAVVFVLAYTSIATEHWIKINKSATALLAAGLMWTLYSFASPLGVEGVSHQLTEKLAETAAIVFFLICAMTIVEVTDAHGGFEVITSRIKATKLYEPALDHRLHRLLPFFHTRQYDDDYRYGRPDETPA